MKKRSKVALDLNALKVETFEVHDPEGLFMRGTVEGHQDTFQPCCTWSCGGTCGAAPDTTFAKGAAAGPLGTRFCTNQLCCA